MRYQEALEIATADLLSLRGHTIDVLTVSRPRDVQGAIELSKIVSKLSPIIGNLLEYAITRHLNETGNWQEDYQWIRQDPGFPDLILSGIPDIQPGIEVKTWFPLSTEITARFRDSQTHFSANQVKVVIVCWMLEYVLAGQPKIVDIWVGDALEIAKTRDNHYHNPPSYVVMEPEDTRQRTRNLQQTNCHGYKFQGTEEQFNQAMHLIQDWGYKAQQYRPAPDYQRRIRQLTGSFPYRLDTNFAKMDRINLPSLETFKVNVLNSIYTGHSIQSWIRAINSRDRTVLQQLVDPSAPMPIE